MHSCILFTVMICTRNDFSVISTETCSWMTPDFTKTAMLCFANCWNEYPLKTALLWTSWNPVKLNLMCLCTLLHFKMFSRAMFKVSLLIVKMKRRTLAGVMSSVGSALPPLGSVCHYFLGSWVWDQSGAET